MNYQIEQADMAMDGTDNQQASNIKQEYNLARIGLNMDQSVNQVQKGQLTYALNAQVDNFDGSSLNYQNEAGNVFCMNFPTGYKVIGEHFIQEKNKHIFFLVNPQTGDRIVYAIAPKISTGLRNQVTGQSYDIGGSRTPVMSVDSNGNVTQL